MIYFLNACYLSYYEQFILTASSLFHPVFGGKVSTSTVLAEEEDDNMTSSELKFVFSSYIKYDFILIA